MLKKKASGWDLVAQFRDNDDEPSVKMDVKGSAKIGQDVRDAFLEVVWDLASEDTFGTYMCDIIGFDEITFDSLIERTSEVTIFEGNVTASDLMDLLLELKNNLSSIENEPGDTASLQKDVDDMHLKIDSAIRNVTSLAVNFDTFSDEANVMKQAVKYIDTEIKHLKDKANSIDKNMKLLNETAKSVEVEVSSLEVDISSFDGEIGALENTVDSMTKKTNLLEKKVENLSGEVAHLLSLTKSGDKIPQDLSFGSITTNSANDVSWPGGWYSLLLTKAGCPSQEPFTGLSDLHLRARTNSRTYFFCETSGGFNARPWPDGSYCVNKMFGLPCPAGFQFGKVNVSSANASIFVFKDLPTEFEFCCKTSGSFNAPMVLPTHSDFVLYRRGGECQQVESMKASSKVTVLSIGDVQSVHSRVKTGVLPDVDISPGSPMKFRICYYNKM